MKPLFKVLPPRPPPIEFNGTSYDSVEKAKVAALGVLFDKKIDEAAFERIVRSARAVIGILSWQPGEAPAKPMRKRRKDFGTKRATNEKPSSDLVDQCSEAVIAEHKASVSFIQRRFFLGYQKALTIMAELERRGVVGPANGSQPRAILQASTPAGATVAASIKYAGK